MNIAQQALAGGEDGLDFAELAAAFGVVESLLGGVHEVVHLFFAINFVFARRAAERHADAHAHF